MDSVALILKIQPFFIALALGLLIGIERERSHPIGSQPLGSRTFVLFSLLGAIAASINLPFVSLSITLFVGGIVIAGYFLSSSKSETNPDIGFTTEVAAVVTYALGFLAYKDSFLALIIGIIVLIILMARTKLHTFSREKLKAEEMQATVIILVLAIGIVPFLPDRNMGPLLILNPQRFGLLVLIIALLQFGAYAAIRIFGAKTGILLSGFLAGIVSSTAATATLSQEIKKKMTSQIAGAHAVVFSTIAMFLKVLLIIYLASPDLLQITALPMLLDIFIMTGLILAITDKSNADHFPSPKNPLALGAAFKLAILLFVMLIIITLAQRSLGNLGAQFASFLGGLFEIQGVILAVSALHHSHQITAVQALNNISIAILASFISKYVIIWSITRNKYAFWASGMLGLMIIIYASMWASIVYLGA
ncbi:MAG: MgtC/SapB family protein [Proteobacteria bacterium]|nr:MgtC/SapB family protein [Pseudomonadota bacterium]